MRLILIFLSSFILPANAGTLPHSKDEFCLRFTDSEKIQSLSSDQDNHMSFKNNGGLFNGGVCWWHSRFQRNILYLGILRPDLPKPPHVEAIKIIKAIRESSEIIIIPGFDSFYDFTKTYQDEIQKELNAWQIYDGLVLGGWIDGLEGDTKVAPDALKSMMNELHDYVTNKKKIAYQKLQIKGITSHAWLVTNTKMHETGMDIGYIDSNDPVATNFYSYKNGDESFFVKGYGNFVPYLEFKREEERISNLGKAYCQISYSFKNNPNAYQKDLDDFNLNR